MAVADQRLSPALPPSPPPSPSRRRHKKRADPFLELNSTPLSSPSPPSSPKDEEQEQESLLTRIIISPILFTSFLLSLFLVNRNDRARRTTSISHFSSRSNLLSYLYPSTWISPEPYQDPSDSTRGPQDSVSSSGHAEPHGFFRIAQRGKEKQNSWHLHKKIRQVTKLEINDAFELRSRVIAAMITVLVLLVVGVVLAVRWAVMRIWVGSG
ncbi:hypothetical protein K469DRAFT_666045 [Zopfia rhizophila CBS 207.26]|uniref:Uncharacterized protein n=1 Tax=Zopfia rhizophila CBS 207.26 TaxID=1314779 RepID=A0A6A6E4Q3_9PEZI|nr:hypothetical protein K469DRAFT_666045 [Zopfia rhizophila CBS 207.26]